MYKKRYSNITYKWHISCHENGEFLYLVANFYKEKYADIFLNNLIESSLDEVKEEK